MFSISQIFDALSYEASPTEFVRGIGAAVVMKRRIDGMKAIRRSFDIGLKEAKDIFEEIEDCVRADLRLTGALNEETIAGRLGKLVIVSQARRIQELKRLLTDAQMGNTFVRVAS